MKSLSERVSYLKGLSEGLNVAEIGPQGKIINGVLDVLVDVIGDISLLKAEFDDFKEYVQSIDDDLNLLEEDIYDTSDGCVEMTCENCGEEICFDSDILEDDDVVEVICPKCNQVVFVNDGSFDMEPSVIDDELQGKTPREKEGVNPDNRSTQ